MTQPAWWTEADQAELDRILWELCTVAETHRDCAACAAARAYGYPVCRRLSAATEAVLDWRRTRQLQSRAEWLRRERVLGYLAELRRGLAA